MKYKGSFGCATLGFCVCLALSAHAQPQAPPPPPTEPAVPEVPAAPAAPAAPAPAAPAAPPSAGTAEVKPAAALPPVQQGSEPSPAPANDRKPASVPAAPAPAAAVAVTPADNEAVLGFSGKLGTHQEHWLAWLGVRNDYVHDATFDLFATNDALTVFSVGAGRTVWVSGDLSVAALGLWEIGGRSAEIRGNDASIRVQRFLLAPEVRYHLHYRVYGFGRLGLGAEYVHATLENALFAGDLVSNSWAFAGDLTGGAAVEAFGHPSGEQRKPRMWLVAEGGYSLVTNTTLSFAAESGAPERTEAEEMGELDLSAPFFRLAVVGTY